MIGARTMPPGKASMLANGLEPQLVLAVHGRHRVPMEERVARVPLAATPWLLADHNPNHDPTATPAESPAMRPNTEPVVSPEPPG